MPCCRASCDVSYGDEETMADVFGIQAMEGNLYCTSRLGDGRWQTCGLSGKFEKPISRSHHKAPGLEHSTGGHIYHNIMRALPRYTYSVQYRCGLQNAVPDSPPRQNLDIRYARLSCCSGLATLVLPGLSHKLVFAEKDICAHLRKIASRASGASDSTQIRRSSPEGFAGDSKEKDSTSNRA
jgi:hypothetical protein